MLYALFVLLIIAICVLVWKVLFSIFMFLLTGLGAVISIILALSVPTIIAIIVFYILFKIFNEIIEK